MQLDKPSQILKGNLDAASALNIVFPCSLVSGEIKDTSEIAYRQLQSITEEK